MLVKSDNAILHKPSNLVTQEELDDFDNKVKPTIDKIKMVLEKPTALGLSACQIGIDSSIFGIKDGNKIKICINPQILAVSKDTSIYEEGCLSYPGLWIKISRSSSIAVSYINENNELINEQLNDISARIWLHEYDHTLGVCFVDRVSKLKLSMAKRKMKKSGK